MASGAIARTAVPPISVRWRARGGSALSMAALAAITVAGVAVFLYPFLLSTAPKGASDVARTEDAPLVFGMLIALALLLFVLELGRQGMNAKVVSVLAVVIVAAAALRIPTLPAGANAFFFLVIIGGYVFGARLGFLVGAGAMFLSAAALGGFGPWLPFQMFASGWIGMTAGWLGVALPRATRGHKRVEVAALAAFGFVWGFLFGAIMNVWFWPFVAGGESISWEPGMGVATTLQHYWSFYILTSAGWDAWRAMANAALIIAAGRPVLDLLARYRDRFQIRFD